MAFTFKYAVLRLVPDARRGESLNVGLIVYRPAGVDVRLIASPRKIQAIAGSFDTAKLYGIAEQIRLWTATLESPEEKNRILKSFGGFSTSELGFFEADNSGYELIVRKLMDSFVNSRPPRLKMAKRSRIRTELKGIFRRQEILGSKRDEIDNHLIISEFPVAEDEGLFVDFALKNGVYHLTETMDFRVRTDHLSSKLKESGFSALTLDRAKAALGPGTRRYVVYAANENEDSAISQHLKLLGRSADQILNFASASDRAFYMNEMLRAAGASLLN